MIEYVCCQIWFGQYADFNCKCFRPDVTLSLVTLWLFIMHLIKIFTTALNLLSLALLRPCTEEMRRFLLTEVLGGSIFSNYAFYYLPFL